MNAQTLTQGGTSEAQASIAAMEAAVAGIERTTISDLLEQQADLLEQSKDAEKIDDTVVRAAKMEIINSDMASLQQKIDSFREDTAELIAGLEAQFEKLGLDLSALQKPAPEDLAVVEKAEKYLKDLESTAITRRAELQTEITEAEGAWIGKDRKVADATTALEQFNAKYEEDVATAKVAIEESKAEVERRKRKRIRDADFDAQFTRFIHLATQIQTKLLENVKGSEVRMVETRKALATSLQAKAGLASEIAALDVQIQAAESVLLASEQELAGAVDQESRSKIEARLGDERQKLADLNGQKTEKQVTFNANESAATKHQTMLDSLQIQAENQKAHAHKLAIDSRARFVQAQNLVRIIQNTAQEDAASRLHQAGSSLDRTSMEVAARSLIASERTRLQLFKGHEDDRKNFAEISGALAEGRAKIAIEDGEIAARMQQNYGIDPMQSSWLNLAEHMAADETAEAA